MAKTKLSATEPLVTFNNMMIKIRGLSKKEALQAVKVALMNIDAPVVIWDFDKPKVGA